MDEPVSSEDFRRDFELYRERARETAIAVSTDGAIDGYFISPTEYEAMRRAAMHPRVFLTENLPDDLFEAIASTRMDPRHDHLDALLDEDGP